MKGKAEKWGWPWQVITALNAAAHATYRGGEMKAQHPGDVQSSEVIYFGFWLNFLFGKLIACERNIAIAQYIPG